MTDEDPEFLVCERCQRRRASRMFWRTRAGDYAPICKDCLTTYIDNSDPQTFKWILELLDTPYIEHLWIKKANKLFKRDPGAFGPQSVIGPYLRDMRLAQYKEFGYKDSDRLNADYNQAQLELAQRRERAKKEKEEQARKLREKAEQGEITEAEFRTRMPVTEPDEEEIQELKFPTTIDDTEQRILQELTQEDIQYLSLKWGTLYKPTEWVYLERLYNEYAAENELNTDRRETLKKICKTSLKMDQAIDVGDTMDYTKLSNVYEQLRKSAKFTEAQNKEEEVRDIDSIGELVAFVEQKGGIIGKQFDPINDPQDKVDFCIRDIKNYLRRLVVDEQGLGDLIESFIEKSENQKSETMEDILATDFKAEEDARKDKYQDYEEFKIQQIEEEGQKLIQEFAQDGA